MNSTFNKYIVPDLILVFNETGRSLEVSVDHLLNERIEIDASLPAENALGFGGVAVEEP
jgi:hypothetical protein